MGKKHRLTAAIAFFVILSASFALPTRSHAAGMSIGPYVWYTWWMPSFKEYYRNNSPFLTPIKSSFVNDPAFLYGPVISFNFSRVSWSNILAIGRYDIKSRTYSVCPLYPQFGVIPVNCSFKTIRYDLDSTLNFTINKIVKIFIGLKYQNYSVKDVNNQPIPSTGNLAGYFTSVKYTYHGTGLGVGASFTFNLVENLFLLWNLSLTGYVPYVKQDGMAALLGMMNMPLVFPVKKPYTSSAIGPNSTLSFAYYIPKAGLTIAPGFRYQYLYYLGSRVPFNNRKKSLSSKSDHFFGVNMSVVYSFNFNKEKEEDES